jgi:hypothetical protein
MRMAEPRNTYTKNEYFCHIQVVFVSQLDWSITTKEKVQRKGERKHKIQKVGIKYQSRSQNPQGY